MAGETTENPHIKIVKGIVGKNGFRFDIDEVRNFSTDYNNIYISGWFFSENLDEVSNVRIKIKDREFIGCYGIERNESAKFGENKGILSSGFEIMVPAQQSEFRFTLEAQVNNSEKWLKVTEGTLSSSLGKEAIEELYQRIDSNGDQYRVKNGFLFNLYESENIKADGLDYFLRGWCFTDRLAEIKSIRCRTDRAYIEGRYKLERIELIDLFGEHHTILHSGFEIPVSPRPGTTPITLEAYVDDGQWLTVVQGTLCRPLLPRRIHFTYE